MTKQDLTIYLVNEDISSNELMLLSEVALRKDWDRPAEDAAWQSSYSQESPDDCVKAL